MRKLNLLFVENTLREKGIRIFTLLEFERIFGVSKTASKKFLENYTKKSFFGRPRQSFYVTNFDPPGSFLIANKIYWPSYISFETALSFYHIIAETVSAVTSATPRASREFRFGEQVFIYSTIKKDIYSFYTPTMILNETILIAEREKALADFLYFVAMGKKNIPDRFDLSKINKKLLLKYIAYYNFRPLERLVKNVI
ncbi:hypothetical protein A3F02_00590 [Candidatus Curtissbacteria bacterium RIFCSPHIGHO2_12_FULL_38_9b]|uniref:Transcriptional regulator n=2 Tax=Candidatus Curtissiibacteriota TaxID=1752717 RepID=A0A1F5GW58_9BACT|nr:MAG: hypothetical protein A3A48_00585 [Candidatus Curtissbacteria bacterium RIFCSPLOWO2_01_FULL_37_9]OGD96091.1 MAG: hypothetical protein A3F02_00590 [Candidatus Curtissbacteria bacterium RIFCSPHIGHO2_12_FULL_38_9b]